MIAGGFKAFGFKAEFGGCFLFEKVKRDLSRNGIGRLHPLNEGILKFGFIR
jgi:hypothetical protein